MQKTPTSSDPPPPVSGSEDTGMHRSMLEDRLLKVFDVSVKQSRHALWILSFVWVLFVALAAVAGYQAFNNWRIVRKELDRATQDFNRQIAEQKHELKLLPWRAELDFARDELRAAQPIDKDKRFIDDAIWKNLWGTLRRAEGRDIFDDVLNQFPSLLPLIPLDVSDVDFTDNYRCRIFIYEFLIKSRVADVANAARNSVPDGETLRAIAARNLSKVEKGKEAEFRESLERLISLTNQ